ncbi:hypothetical protein D9758_009067 [Tetrapyrgos nigripes]|uniref:Secreted protein n=1 Tax=Tetrapyrgos nigripes TaxID=182062 RepID=A0A8H5GA76_9AGAR|nr:hypothetical protein D9758_009067 [Tetrapyrgos nigripes]
MAMSLFLSLLVAALVPSRRNGSETSCAHTNPVHIPPALTAPPATFLIPSVTVVCMRVSIAEYTL